MEFDASLLVIAVIFSIAYVILRVFLFRPLVRVIKSREARVESAQKAYDAASGEANAKLESERDKLTSARREVADHRDALRREAQQKRREMLEEARAVADRELETVRRELEEQVETERVKIEVEAQRLAGLMARRVLGRAS